MTTELCLNALNMAIKGRRPKAGLIVHSDRGSQYCSQAHRRHLEEHQLVCSMSRKGNCYDNASIESFRGSMKNELIHQTEYESRGVQQLHAESCVVTPFKKYPSNSTGVKQRSGESSKDYAFLKLP